MLILGKGYGMETVMFTVGYVFCALSLQHLSLSSLDGNAAAQELYTKM